MPLGKLLYIDDQIVIGYSKGKGTVAISRLQSGDLLWTYPGFGGDAIALTNLLFKQTTFDLEIERALDIHSGEVVWTFDPETNVKYHLLENKGQIIIVPRYTFGEDDDLDVTIYALDAVTGNLVWKYESPLSFESIVETDSMVIFITEFTIDALDLATGKLIGR